MSTGIGYRHPIEEVLPILAAASFRTLEVSTAPHHLPLDDRHRLAAVRERMEALGMRAHSLHAPFGHDVSITSPEARERQRALDRLARAADAAEQLGPALYVVHPGGEDQRWVWEREHRLELSVEGLTRIWNLCRERGLRLVLETPLPHLLGGRPGDLLWILERLPRDGTGVCVDTSHCALGGFLFEVLERLGKQVVHVQVSDNNGATDDHLPPGEGLIDWGRFHAALAGIGYDGVYMLEVAGDGDVTAHARRAAGALRRLRELP